jgi:hypothetical protein
MPYEISIEKTAEFLRITVAGQANFDNITGVWKDIARACTEFGCSNVLLDSILSGRPSTLDIYRTGNRVHELGLPSNLRVAFVCEKESLARLDFHETVIANRAVGVSIRNFVDQTDAEQWLTEEQCDCTAAPARERGRDPTEQSH